MRVRRKDPPHGPASRGHHFRGFTLLEVQVAIFVFVLAIVGMVGHARVYARLLSWVETDRQLEGVTVVSENRVVMTVTDAGVGATAPRCEIRLKGIDTSGLYPVVDVTVGRRTP